LLLHGSDTAEFVAAYDSATHAPIDSDFDLTGVCPAT
jgi:hypothetical protein